MVYHVRVTPPAEADARGAFAYLWSVSPTHAVRWLTGLSNALDSLAVMPNRCPILPEAADVGRCVRFLLYGKRPNAYKIMYEVVAHDANEAEVRVLRIRHGAMDTLDFNEMPGGDVL